MSLACKDPFPMIWIINIRMDEIGGRDYKYYLHVLYKEDVENTPYFIHELLRVTNV